MPDECKNYKGRHTFCRITLTRPAKHHVNRLLKQSLCRLATQPDAENAWIILRAGGVFVRFRLPFETDIRWSLHESFPAPATASQ